VGVPQEIGPGEAARILGVSTSTVLGYEERGILRARRLPSGHRRFDRDEVQALRDRGVPAPTPEPGREEAAS